jgi:hypothetical protein
MKECFLVHAQKALQDMQLRANNAFETDEMQAVALHRSTRSLGLILI